MSIRDRKPSPMATVTKAARRRVHRIAPSTWSNGPALAVAQQPEISEQADQVTDRALSGRNMVIDSDGKPQPIVVWPSEPGVTHGL